MRACAQLLAGPLLAAALLMAGCQHEAPAAPGPAKHADSGSGNRRPKNPEAKEKPKAKPKQTSPEPVPTKTTEETVRAEKNPAPAPKEAAPKGIDAPKAVDAGKTESTEPSPAPNPPMKAAPEQRNPADQDAAENDPRPSTRRPKTPPNAPSVGLADRTDAATTSSAAQPRLSGLDPERRADGRPAPKALSLKPGATSGTRSAALPSPVKSGALLSSEATAAVDAPRSAKVELNDDPKSVPRASGAPVALPAAAEEKSVRTERIAKPLNLTQWLADEKAHAEWLRRQQEKQAAANAARETESLRLKRARDRLVSDENPEAPEKSPARE